jgi:hypothetical protein
VVPLATRSDGFLFTDATTQPTSTAVADERVDLVILVNDDGALLQQPMPNAPAQPQQTETSQEAAPPATTAPANAAPTIPAPTTPAPTTTESAPATQPAL